MKSLDAELALHQAHRLPTNPRPGGDDAQTAAAKFETLVFGELIKAMRATVPRDEEDESFGLELSESMFDEAIADASAGSLGLERLFARELGEDGSAAPVPGIEMPHRHRGALAAYRPTETVPSVTVQGPRSRYGALAPALPVAGERPTVGVVSSHFGWRHHPIKHTRSFHEGLDIAAPEGTEITAVQAGRVRFAGRRGSLGNLVELEHADGSITRYAHASRLFVRRGDRVEVGETIADVGATGAATGPHLHFEALVNDKAVDPERYLAKLRAQAEDSR
ncbi:MAG: hypothetical protein B7733_09630 [Myxococcales bacterium FL481]|nr:MAG: hypothetical protein B7733_09630 [Myxococcales bacterium FL481]